MSSNEPPTVVPPLNVKPISSVPLSILPLTTTTTTEPSSPTTTTPPSSFASSASTSSTSTFTQIAENNSDAPGSQPASNPGLIAGVVIGVLLLLVVVLFLVRYMFIRHRNQHRESGQRLAYSKARYAISAPTNFTVLESGTFVGNVTERPGTSMSIQPSLEDWNHGADVERVGSPERMRERYPYEAMSGLESGLKTQMQTMKFTRKPVPTYTTEAND